MRARLKALSFQTLVYGSGHVLARLVTFLLLPLYTNVFSPQDYGVVSLAYVFMGFMAVILHYGLDAALMKYYVAAETSARRQYLTSALLSFLVSSLLFSGALILLRNTIAEALLGVHQPRYIVYIAAILMADILWSLPMLVLRAEEKPLVFITFSLLNVCLSLGLNILLIVYVRLGVEGVLLSNLITSLVVLLASLPVLLKRIDLRRASLLSWKQMLRFGLPFLPSGIFAMIMELAGRYILKYLTDLETVGIYNAGYKLGMLMLLVSMGFNMAWQPFFLKEGDSDEKRRLFARIASYALVLLGFVWVLMLLWVDVLIRIPIAGTSFYGAEFWSSSRIVPWIALGYIFQATYLLQLPGPFLTGKSHWVAYTRAAGALATVVLNLALIPAYGALGSAVAMCLSYILMSVFMQAVNRRIYPLRYEWTRLLRIGGLLLLVYGLNLHFPGSVLQKILLTCLYPLGILFSGFLTPRERDLIRTRFRPANRRPR